MKFWFRFMPRKSPELPWWLVLPGIVVLVFVLIGLVDCKSGYTGYRPVEGAISGLIRALKC